MGEEELAKVVQDVLLSSGIFTSLIASFQRTENGLEVVLDSGESYEIKVQRNE